MNKFIESDIKTGLQYLKVGIMNALSDIEKGECDNVILGDYVPFSLVVKCAEERGWKEYEGIEHDPIETNGWEVDCWYYMTLPDGKLVYISSCLWKGQATEITVEK